MNKAPNVSIKLASQLQLELVHLGCSGTKLLLHSEKASPKEKLLMVQVKNSWFSDINENVLAVLLCGTTAV